MKCNVQLSRHCALFRRRFFFLFSVIILHGFWRWGRREKWALLCSIRFCLLQWGQTFSEIIAILVKGHIILKFLFSLLSFNHDTKTCRILVKTNLFVRFLEESEDTKSRFEIIWTLHTTGCSAIDTAFWIPHFLKSIHPYATFINISLLITNS